MADDAWVLDDDDRYARLRLIAWWDQQKLQKAKVLVVGAGALGNEVLKNLALMGIGTIYVADFDHIERSNLTRAVLYRSEDCGRPKAEAAAEATRRLNPDVVVHPLHADIVSQVGLGLFREMDVVIGCLDNREARLWVNRSCWKVSKPWIDGGIQEINGVVKAFIPPESACYECAMTENDYRLINLRYSCPLLRREDILAGKVPTAPTIASVIGGMQVQEALKILHGLESLSGEALVFNGVANQFYRTKYQFREDCLSHETFSDLIELPLSHTDRVSTLMQAAAEISGEPSLELILERDLVVALGCTKCDYREPMLHLLHSLSVDAARCPHCGEVTKPQIEHRISQGSSLANELLAAVGVPAYDAVRVMSASGERIYLLAGDRAQVVPV